MSKSLEHLEGFTFFPVLHLYEASFRLTAWCHSACIPKCRLMSDVLWTGGGRREEVSGVLWLPVLLRLVFLDATCPCDGSGRTEIIPQWLRENKCVTENANCVCCNGSRQKHWWTLSWPHIGMSILLWIGFSFHCSKPLKRLLRLQSLCFFQYISLSVFISVYLSEYISFSVLISVWFFQYISFSIFQYISFSIFLAVYFFECISFNIFLSEYFFRCISSIVFFSVYFF